MQKSGTGLSRSHHVVFEDSLNHRSEHFDHNARPRSLPTVLQHTRSTGVNKEALLIICNIYDRRNVFSIRCTRAHLTEELAQIRWRVVVFQKRSDGLHKHTCTHTNRWLFPYHISYLHRPRASMLSGEGAVWKQATGELHKHCNFPKHQAPPALPSYHRVGIDRHGRKHTNKKNLA